MDRNVYIICSSFYDFSLNKKIIGGVETYISNLIPLFVENGFRPKLFQFGIKNLETTIDGVFIKSVGGSQKAAKRFPKKLFKGAILDFDKTRDVLLFADDWLVVKNTIPNSIAIQHGIYWDVPQKQRNLLKMLFSGLLFTYKQMKRSSYTKRVVCVDFNYINWLRAQLDNVEAKITVIPNFSNILSEDSIHKDNEKIKIIFARRLQPFRGTRVFSDAISRLLKEGYDLDITIAGSGPDEKYMREKLKEYEKNILFTEYASFDSLKIHSDKNIAVIPTIGSEGTSLSLLEAMASECAVVCTNVGGMTNIVINNHNGIMIDANNADQLYDAIKELIDCPEKRKKIAKNAYKTICQSFSFERWAGEWRKIISTL
jgi:glycosyltransferase involved in cell wall biosynthesis